MIVLGELNYFNVFSHSLTFVLCLQVKGPTDHSYFDNYPPDEEIPPDEMSGWDVDF